MLLTSSRRTVVIRPVARIPALAGASGKAGRGGSDRATPTRSLVFVASAFDFSDHKAAAYAPQMTLEMYLAFPEDASKLIEVVDGWIVTTDIRDKRAEYAAAGIPHYWIVRMTDNDGPAISVERLLLTSDGEYTREGLAIRGRDFHAIDTISPFPLKRTWEALDEGL
jgi:hypothetical protein